MRLGLAAMLGLPCCVTCETRLGCHAVSRVRADMRLGWVAMLCHVYEL